mmetsp:Transcript_15240/g.43367  ORF Transcript_15240/g.43367 Transcript_15240/m.43367 type:complete len:279 (-) Transcript_15240:408-1244(-)
MWIAMHAPGDEQLRQGALNAHPHQIQNLPIRVGAILHELVRAFAIHPLGYEHPIRAERFNRRGNGDKLQRPVCLEKVLRVAHLVPEVALSEEAHPHVVHQHAQIPRDAGKLLNDPHGRPEQPNVRLDRVIHPWPANLDRNPLPAVFRLQRPLVHLPHRRRRKGRGGQLVEYLKDRPAQLRLEYLVRLLVRKRGNRVLELGQRLGVLVAHEIRTHTRRLRKLDKRRPEFGHNLLHDKPDLLLVHGHPVDRAGNLLRQVHAEEVQRRQRDFHAPEKFFNL